MPIQKMFILKDGILLVDKNFKGNLNVEMRLLSGFISATQTFSKEMTGSSMRSMNFDNLTFHFYLDKKIPGLFYVLITDSDYNFKEVRCKLLKISSLFIDNYSKYLVKFSGDISPFSAFKDLLSKIKIGKRYCGDRKKCTFCRYREESSSINFKIKDEKNDIVNKLTNWLNQLIVNLHEVQSTFIIDYDGFIVSQNTREEISEVELERIINMVSPTLEKLKSYSEPSNTSGSLISDEYRLFYLEMGGPNSALLVMVSKPSYKIQKALPYIYFIADNISSLLNGRPISHVLPDIKGSGDLSLPLSQEQNTSKNFVYPIFIIGAPKSGKTTFVHSIINNKIRMEYKPTIGLSIYKKNYQISKDLRITFLFFDLGALQTILEARKEYYKLISPQILLGMFDISQLSSFNKLKELIEESIHYFGNRPEKVILIGNKIDKIKINNNMENHISSIKKQYNCPYFEISALNGEDSERILTYLISNLDLKEGIMRCDT